jgi:hypothetical protein
MNLMGYLSRATSLQYWNVQLQTQIWASESPVHNYEISQVSASAQAIDHLASYLKRLSETNYPAKLIYETVPTGAGTRKSPWGSLEMEGRSCVVTICWRCFGISRHTQEVCSSRFQTLTCNAPVNGSRSERVTRHWHRTRLCSHLARGPWGKFSRTSVPESPGSSKLRILYSVSFEKSVSKFTAGFFFWRQNTFLSKWGPTRVNPSVFCSQKKEPWFTAGTVNVRNPPTMNLMYGTLQHELSAERGHVLQIVQQYLYGATYYSNT